MKAVGGSRKSTLAPVPTLIWGLPTKIARAVLVAPHPPRRAWWLVMAQSWGRMAASGPPPKVSSLQWRKWVVLSVILRVVRLMGTVTSLLLKVTRSKLVFNTGMRPSTAGQNRTAVFIGRRTICYRSYGSKVFITPVSPMEMMRGIPLMPKTSILLPIPIRAGCRVLQCITLTLTSDEANTDTEEQDE